MLLVLFGASLATERGRCELAYWTIFRTNPTPATAARLKALFPKQGRTDQADHEVFTSYVSTPSQAREYLESLPSGRHREDANAILLEAAIAHPDPEHLRAIIRIRPDGRSAAKARKELLHRSTSPVARAVEKYLSDKNVSALAVALKTGGPDPQAVRVIQGRAREAIALSLAEVGLEVTSSWTTAGADLVVEIDVAKAGDFTTNGSFGAGIPGYNTAGTLRLQDNSWSTNFTTHCPRSATYKVSVPRGLEVFSSAPHDAMLNVNADQVFEIVNSRFRLFSTAKP